LLPAGAATAPLHGGAGREVKRGLRREGRLKTEERRGSAGRGALGRDDGFFRERKDVHPHGEDERGERKQDRDDHGRGEEERELEGGELQRS